jgi:hypothetical protein
VSKKSTKTTNPPIGGIYKSSSQNMQASLSKKEDVGFSYFGGLDDWIVYRIPLSRHGLTLLYQRLATTFYDGT